MARTHQDQHEELHATPDRGLVERIAARFSRRRPVMSPTTLPRQHRASLKISLSKMILSATVSYIAGMASVPYIVTAFDIKHADSSRGLTVGEIALAEAIFGSDFDATQVQSHFHRRAPQHSFSHLRHHDLTGALAFVSSKAPRDIHFIDSGTHAHDYSRADDTGYRGGVFIHEMTHVWQFTQKTHAKKCDTYEYTLTSGARFDDFCLEQQGEIIRHYAMRFVIPSHPLMEENAKFNALFREMGHVRERKLSAQDALLAQVVEQKFPHAAQTRLRIQANFNAAGECALRRLHANPALGHQDHFNACAKIHVRTIGGETLTISAQQTALPAIKPSKLARLQHTTS